MTTELQNILPKVRGAYRFGAPLAKTNWFGVGGPAEVLFKPEDTADLAEFLRQVSSLPRRGRVGVGAELAQASNSDFKSSASSVPRPPSSLRGEEQLPITIIGVGSNLIVRDGGIEGIVIRLGRFFNDASIDLDAATDGSVIAAGAAMMDVNLAKFAASWGRAGLEFLSGIPGTVGGALAMNAGAYGCEVKDVLVKAEGVTREGEIVMLSLGDMRYSYRHYGGPEGIIFTRGWFRTTPEAPELVEARMAEIQAKREATQPIRERTGGSTFANPNSSPRRGEDGRGAELVRAEQVQPPPQPSTEGGGSLKAWQLIDAAGCRGLRIGGAQMSELHCNFMINTGDATAADLEALGEEVRKRVLAHSGVDLQWEIRRVGKP